MLNTTKEEETLRAQFECSRAKNDLAAFAQTVFASVENVLLFCGIYCDDTELRSWVQISASQDATLADHFAALFNQLFSPVIFDATPQHLDYLVGKICYNKYKLGTSEDLDTRLKLPKLNDWLRLALSLNDFDALTETCQWYLQQKDCLLTRPRLLNLLDRAVEQYNTPGYVLQARYFSKLAELETDVQCKPFFHEKAYEALLYAEKFEDVSTKELQIAYRGYSIAEIEPQFSSWEQAKSAYENTLSPDKVKYIQLEVIDNSPIKANALN